MYIVISFFGEDALQGRADLGVAIDNQDTSGTRHQPIEGDVVFLHELHEIGNWNPPVFGTGNPVTLDLP